MRYLECVLLGLVALLAAVVVLGDRGPADNARASHDGVTQGAGDEVAIDMVSDSINTANTLGTIQHCVAVAAGTPITFDVVIDGIPASQDLAGFNYIFGPATGSSLSSNFFVTARSSFTGGQNILAAQGLGVALDLGTAPSASAALNGFAIAATDHGGTAETSPTTPRGVMTRFTIATTGAANGVYKMALTSFDLFNATAASYPIDTLLDGEDGYGVIAIGVTCPGAPATPTPTPCLDSDGDGWCDSGDNCPSTANQSQTDTDGDGTGDICDNCPSTSNAGQENYDGDTMGDACDPDDDNDSLPDGTDPCPLDADCDNDGYWDSDETAKGSVVLNGASTPEHCDTTDNDGDTVLDEAPTLSGRATPDPLCAPGADPDGDTIANAADPDDDNDGFSDANEQYMSTDELDDCPVPPVDVGYDAWPPDADGDGDADIGDVIQLFGMGKILQDVGDPFYSRRSDANGNGQVNVGDVLILYGGGKIFTTC